MALARLASKKLQQRVISPSSLLSQSGNSKEQQRWGFQLMNRLCTTSAADHKGTPSTGGQVAVSDQQGGSKSSVSTKKQGKRNLWRNNNREFVPALWGLGNALMQATENINRVFEKFKEKEECYKLKYKMPGIGKDDVQIAVEDGGVLRIRGEHKEEEDEDPDKYWAYYDTRLLLPEDAKIDEIKAEMKHGVLKITIPRDEKIKKDVKEIPVE